MDEGVILTDGSINLQELHALQLPFPDFLARALVGLLTARNATLHQITHLLLERGHLWRRREVAIPMEAITKVETDSVTVGLTTRELGQLPSVPAHRRHRA